MKQLLSGALTLGILFTFQPEIQAQSDIENHWAKDTIATWIDKGWISGYDEETYLPNKPVTRAEFVTFISRSFNLSEQFDIDYIDVNNTDWFYGQLQLSAPYISGYEDGSFQPNKTITRQEGAVILARLISAEQAKGQELTFNDIDSVSSWAKPAIQLVVSNGLMGGYPDDTFQPNQPITRAEAIVTLNRSQNFVSKHVQEEVQENVNNQEEAPNEPAVDDSNTDAATTPTNNTSSPDGNKGDNDSSDSSENDEKLEILSATVKVGGTNLKAKKISDGTFEVKLPDDDKAKFTHFTIKGTENIDSLEASIYPVSREIEFENGKAEMSISKLLGSFDNGGDGVSVQKIKESMDGDSFTIKGEVTGTNGETKPLKLILKK
ncbi:S-layer homology domain-containing protein [Bacillus solimangrovi]|nr:S-layer homology domain-containing protein [Bacillus solimangrovi]